MSMAFWHRYCSYKDRHCAAARLRCDGIILSVLLQISSIPTQHASEKNGWIFGEDVDKSMLSLFRFTVYVHHTGLEYRLRATAATRRLPSVIHKPNFINFH